MNTLGFNNGPTFISDPNFFLAAGQAASISYAVTDQEGDSLAYEFTPTMVSLGNPATYVAPYSAMRPMPWTGVLNGISCNAATGIVAFTPGNTSNQTFSGVIAVAVQQWVKLNGVYQLLSTTKRDAPCFILNNAVPNNEPTIRTNPPSTIAPNKPQTEWTVVAGTNLCFIATAKDTDFFPPQLSDTTYLRIENGLSELGAQFTPSYIIRPREDEWVFCWTPADSLIRPQPYRFNLVASDNRCPFPGRITMPFSIKVIPAPLTATIELVACGTYRLELQKSLYQIQDLVTKVAVAPYKPGEAIQYQSFIFQQELFVSRVQNGDYPVIWEYKINGVSQTLTDTIRHKQPLFSVQIPDTFVCNQAGLTLEPVFQNGFSNDCKWYQQNDTNQLISRECTLNRFIEFDEWIWIRSVDSFGCIAVDSALIRSLPKISSLTTTNPTCIGVANGRIEVLAPPPATDYLFQLNGNQEQPNALFANLDTGKYNIIVKHRLGCSRLLPGIELRSDQVLSIGELLTEPPTCIGLNNGSIEVRDINGGIPPYWYRINNLPFSSSPQFTDLSTDTFSVTVMDATGCKRLSTAIVPEAESLFRNPNIIGDTLVKPFEISLYKIDPEPFFETRWYLLGGGFIRNQTDSFAAIQWTTPGIHFIDIFKKKSADCEERTYLEVTVMAVGSVDELNLGRIHLYPNPVHRAFQLEVERIPDSSIHWKITDIQGKLLLSKQVEQQQTIDLAAFPAGIYLLRIGSYTTKLVKCD